MNQTKLGSFIEAMMNTLIGYVINLAAQLAIYPAFGATFTFMQNVYIGLIFMVISIVRGFLIRRWFNARLHRVAQATASALNR